MEKALNSYYKLTGNYDELSNIVPDTIEGHFHLWQFYEKKELHDKSAEEKKILLAKPSEFSLKASSDLYINRGGIYTKMEEYDKAVAEFKKALTLNPLDWRSYNQMGTAYLQNNQIQKAIESFKNHIKGNYKKKEWSYFKLAQIYESQGKKSEAEQIWQTILDLKNPHPNVEKIARKELKIINK
ncbi:MAG: tetratricopeptide repeat protein [Candidatus Mariimomonas ferrooxydans]